MHIVLSTLFFFIRKQDSDSDWTADTQTSRACDSTRKHAVNHEDRAESLMVPICTASEKLPVSPWNYGMSVRYNPGVESSGASRLAPGLHPPPPPPPLARRGVSTGSRPESRMRRRRMKTRRDRAASHTRRFSPSSPSAPVWARRRSPGR